MTTMTDSRALAAIGEALHASAPKPGNWRDELHAAYDHIAARLREPAGVDWTHDAEQWGKARRGAE